MGLFSKRKLPPQEVINELLALSQQAVEQAKPHIEESGTFIPFAAVVTTDNSLNQIVYFDPDKDEVDPRHHASMIQKILMERYQEPTCRLIYMAWDGIAHLKTGDKNCITIRVGNKQLNLHKLLLYPYELRDGKVIIDNPENPIVTEV